MAVKLIGNKTEKDFRAELVRSNKGLRESESKLRKALESEGHDVSNAYVLHCTPDQLEDIYVVLIEGSFLVSIEIDRFDNSKSPIFERIELKDYLHGLSKTDQIRLAVAQDLAAVV